ncbi:NAD(P)-binding protein [Sistotremastrum niveocremeum HHB9708]|uniref:NAD(P)-binding protein n=1 Tax=Sistotremastrum niveocremeum HHB9708 TaxID=1314777 RepID=A0A165AJ89_9AGAM|nr:NAD(P)-binding protein [Sistotremastrum niveocremeum HHB9708]
MSVKALRVTNVALVVKPAGKLYEPQLETRRLRDLAEGEVLIRITAAAFNHRDLWILKNQYPGIAVGSVFGSDACGTIINSSVSDDPLLHKRVFIAPMTGWYSSPDGPESRFGIVGGGSFPSFGTMQQFAIVKRTEVVIALPEHLSDEEGAAWPLAGVTAWRAVFTKANVLAGQNVLITGIGGGVALTALQLCIAKGANVYVTSGSQIKIQKAKALGARQGFDYTNASWTRSLKKLLESEGKVLDSVIDSAGGSISSQITPLLKPGGVIVCYGMTASPTIPFSMREVLKNIELKGSTMGSLSELKAATEFMAEHQIRPVVDSVLPGLEKAQDGFEKMRSGKQFGKIVVRVDRPVSKL